VLDKIDVIPGLSQAVEAQLPEKVKRALQSPDTAIASISLPLSVDKGRVIVTKANITAEEFILICDGTAGIAGDFEIAGEMRIPQDVSLAMISSVAQLKYLVNDQKQIAMPLKVSGNVYNTKGISYAVDKEYITQRLVENQVNQQLDKALDKVFGSDEKAQSTAETQKDADQKAAVKGAVNDLLGNFLKKK
jgi:hypothetical protein